MTLRIALLGAESTGKTSLSLALAECLRADGHSVAVVGEVLREWCAREGRTPEPHEQLPIAQEQERRVEDAARSAGVVIADTTALMVAVYSAMLFKDGTLYRFALERQRLYHATLVTGLDVPWVPDGLQRDGPHVRAPVDTCVRAALEDAGIRYQVVYGEGDERLRSALSALADLGLAARPAGDGRPWQWTCEKCSDPECEHRLFSRLVGGRG